MNQYVTIRINCDRDLATEPYAFEAIERLLMGYKVDGIVPYPDEILEAEVIRVDDAPPPS